MKLQMCHIQHHKSDYMQDVMCKKWFGDNISMQTQDKRENVSLNSSTPKRHILLYTPVNTLDYEPLQGA